MDSTIKDEINNQFFPTSSEPVQSAPASGQFDFSSFLNNSSMDSTIKDEINNQFFP